MLTLLTIQAVEYGEAANLDDEDIGGDISCLQPDWTIGDKLLIFKEMAGGELMSITDMELDIGSFVDVVLEPEIINTKRGEVYVRFSMERIIVLRGKPVKVGVIIFMKCILSNPLTIGNCG